MLRLFYTRHGQSVANAAGIYAGAQPHIKLTPLGEEQARAAGAQLARDGISAIIASDLDRAVETAQIIAGIIGYDASKIIYDARLEELDVGKLSGTEDTGFADCLAYLRSGADSTAETIEHAEARLRPLLEELSQRTDTVLLVAHAGIGRVLRSMLTGAPIDDIAAYDVPNAAPYELPTDRLQKETVS